MLTRVMRGQQFLSKTGGSARRLTCGVASASVLAALAACGGSTTVTSVTGPSGTRCDTTVAAQPSTVPPDGGSIQVSVNATRDCAWTAASEATWIQLTVTSGQGPGTFTGTVARNEQPQPRSSAIVVNEQRVAVAQEPRPCTFEVRPTSLRIGRAGGTSTVNLTTITGCEWTASSSVEWIRLSASRGNESAAVELTIAANAGAARSGTVVIAEQRVTVDQEVGVPPCGVSVRPPARTVDGRGSDERFRVETDPGCRWTASSSAPWLNVLNSQGTGPGEVLYSAQTNPTLSERSGAIAVSVGTASATHSVRQAASAVECSYILTPTSMNFPAGGGDGLFHVNAPAACLWNASSGASWVVVRGGGNYGTGGADVSYQVAPNTSSAPRTTRITVGNQSHTVTQAGTASQLP